MSMTKQARTLNTARINQAIKAATSNRHRLIIMLSIKAGLRSCEIAGLDWRNVDCTTKTLLLKTTKGDKPRQVPMAADLFETLTAYWTECGSPVSGPVFTNAKEPGQPVTANAITQWIRRHFAALGWEGYSSHSGRRTFVTRAARHIHQAGGSLRDVQALVGHSSLKTTERYIDTDEDAQRKLVDII